jgi:hypothetical protein
MKILIRNVDSVVIYARDDLSLDDAGVTGDGWRDPHFSALNSRIEEAELPEHWAGAVWSYVGGAWAVFDQAQHDKNIQAAQPPVPQKVSRAQFILALLDLGLLDAVEAAIAAADRATQINYKERLEFERTYPLVMVMASTLGKIEAEVDALFVLAASK